MARSHPGTQVMTQAWCRGPQTSATPQLCVGPRGSTVPSQKEPRWGFLAGLWVSITLRYGQEVGHLVPHSGFQGTSPLWKGDLKERK